MAQEILRENALVFTLLRYSTIWKDTPESTRTWYCCRRNGGGWTVLGRRRYAQKKSALLTEKGGRQIERLLSCSYRTIPTAGVSWRKHTNESITMNIINHEASPPYGTRAPFIPSDSYSSVTEQAGYNTGIPLNSHADIIARSCHPRR